MKFFSNISCQSAAHVLGNKCGSVRQQRFLLLRNGNKGPALQSVYYEVPYSVTTIEIGTAFCYPQKPC